MKRLFIAIDLALLRGDTRGSTLDDFICALNRAWIAYYDADFSFGYQIYDSTIGSYTLNHHLQRVASHLGM